MVTNQTRCALYTNRFSDADKAMLCPSITSKSDAAVSMKKVGSAIPANRPQSQIRISATSGVRVREGASAKTSLVQNPSLWENVWLFAAAELSFLLLLVPVLASKPLAS